MPDLAPSISVPLAGNPSLFSVLMPLQGLMKHRPQRHRRHRLVQNVEPPGLGLARWFGIDVSTDEKSRNLQRERRAEPLDDFKAGAPTRQMVVGNNQIGRMALLGQGLERLAVG